MADAVAAQTISDGNPIIVKLTNVSDGTGEAAVTKVDVSALTGAPSEVAIQRIIYSTAGMGVDILWGATSDVLVWHLPADTSGTLHFGYSDMLV